jgi:hypothetical protein
MCKSASTFRSLFHSPLLQHACEHTRPVSAVRCGLRFGRSWAGLRGWSVVDCLDVSAIDNSERAHTARAHRIAILRPHAKALMRSEITAWLFVRFIERPFCPIAHAALAAFLVLLGDSSSLSAFCDKTYCVNPNGNPLSNTWPAAMISPCLRALRQYEHPAEKRWLADFLASIPEI